MKNEKDDGLMNQNTEATGYSLLHHLLSALLVMVVAVMVCFVLKAAFIGAISYLMRNVQ
jgi:hypothetical protein